MPSRMEDFGFFLTRTFASTKSKKRQWPFVPGKYFVADPFAPVAVTTLGSVELAGQIAQSAPKGLCIVGKVETENIGIEKIIKNVIANPAIRYLVCAGNEPPKHLTGASMVSLFNNGVDERNRIIGSPGMRPILPNTSAAEIQRFREQVQPVDMIGCTDIADIAGKVAELAKAAPETAPAVFIRGGEGPDTQAVEHVVATGTDPMRIKLDASGYFVINTDGKTLVVEHYSYKEKLLRVIEGPDARSLYLTITRNNWVSRLDHAAYLGRELTRAEYSIREKSEYRQDGA